MVKVAFPTFRHATLGPAVVLALALAGCGGGGGLTVPTEGANQPFPQNFRAELLAFYKTYLTNPVGVREAGLAEPVLRKVGGRPRYVACVRYNARQSDGRLRGLQEQAVVFVDGRLDRAVDETEELCGGVSYAPFADLEKLTR